MNELYGIFKKFANDNHYDVFAKVLNSAHITAETKKTMKRLHDEFGHYSQLVIHKDVCYAAFMHNPGGHNDNTSASGMGLAFATFSLEQGLSDDFDYKKDVNLYRVGGIGSTFAGYKSQTGLVPQSLVLIGDLLYLVLGFESEEEKQWGLFVTVYDTAKKAFIDEYQLKLNYKGKVAPYNYEAMNDIYEKEGYQPINPSQMLVSHWNEYKGEYYATVVVECDNESGIIVKTKDFKTIEFVDVVRENTQGSCEVASGIFDGKMYIACRQSWTVPYLIFVRYDIETGAWTNAYKIEDGNSRPMFFVYHDELFLFNTLEEPFGRRYSNISKVRTIKNAHNGKNAPINTIATLFECGDHHSYFIYNDKIYFTATINGRVFFGELKLKEYSPQKVNQKLLDLFKDEE